MSFQKIRKAVIPVAGLGTRMLPATKAIPKEMLPIVDKPMIQYIVNECIAAGIKEIVLVTHSSKNSIENHFDTSYELEATLEKRVKRQLLDEVRSICPTDVTIMQVRQGVAKGLGHAVLCAERVVGNEPFALLLPDDFLTYDGNGIISDLISGYEKTGKTQLSVMEVDGPDISKYGVISPNFEKGSVSGLIEKPEFKNAPSNLASIGRYVLTPDIFDILRNQSIGVADEIQLADSINTQAINNMVETVLLNGRHFDCGSIGGYIAAIKYVSSKLKSY